MMTGKLPREHVLDGGRKGTKSDSRDLALEKIRRLTRDEIGGEEIGMERHGRRLGLERRRRISGAEDLMDASSKALRGASVDNAMGLFLTFKGIVEGALVCGANTNGKAV
jgi:hypothetical protein